GIVVNDNMIVANFGWGATGVTMHSFDGVHFIEDILHTKGNYNGFDYGSGTYIHWSTLATLSSTDGIDWVYGTPGADGGNNAPTPRGFKFLDYDTGRYIGIADGNLIRVSADKGGTWTTAVAPPNCMVGGDSEQILAGNGIAVIMTDG